MPPVIPLFKEPPLDSTSHPLLSPHRARFLSLSSLSSLSHWMPRVDREKLVCVGDRKVSCETLVDAAGGAAVEDPDILAESSEYEIGWVDRNAVYDRNDSTTGSTNPKFGNANRRGTAASNSQVFSSNPKAKTPIIGLPGKIQHSGFDGRNSRRPPRVRIFPKMARRAEGGGRGKSAVPESEPGSPKVSCFGTVLSNRERERRRREAQRAAEGEGEGEWEGRGCLAGFAAIFRRGRGGQTVEEEVENKITLPPKNIPALAGSAPESPADAPVLGEMRRFVSGRRAASWAPEAEAEAEAEAGGKTARVGLWGRRSVGSVDDGERGLE